MGDTSVNTFLQAYANLGYAGLAFRQDPEGAQRPEGQGRTEPFDPQIFAMDSNTDPLLSPSDPRITGKPKRIRAFIRRLMRPAARPAPDSDIFTAARHVTGAIGAGTSPAYEALAKGASSLNRSLRANPLPPSTHISHRDSTRHNIPVPLSERCIEDYRTSDDK